MKKLQTLTLQAAPASAMAWALLFAETAATLALFSSDRVPALLVRCLQIFLRF